MQHTGCLQYMKASFHNSGYYLIDFPIFVFLTILHLTSNMPVPLSFYKFYWEGNSSAIPVLEELLLSASGWLYMTDILWLLKAPVNSFQTPFQEVKCQFSHWSLYEIPRSWISVSQESMCAWGFWRHRPPPSSHTASSRALMMVLPQHTKCSSHSPLSSLDPKSQILLQVFEITTTLFPIPVGCVL